MPGHKGGPGAPALGVSLLGAAAYVADVSEMGGFDYLHGPVSGLRAAQERAAAVFGADRSFFLVNGATAGNLAALLALVGDGERVLVARGSHRSVYAGLVLSGAQPRYLRPVPSARLDGLFGIDPDDIEHELASDPTIRAVHVTSPSYYGFTLPLHEIAEITSARGVPLVVDEAHGTHFRFNKEFPPPALDAGADVVVQSPHKTLGSFTQSSLLHVGGGLVDADRLGQALQMLQSSSPSALLLLSLETAIDEMARTGTERWACAIELAGRARAGVNAIAGISAYGAELEAEPGIAGFDPCKLVIDVSGLGTTGQWAARWLRDEQHLNPEFSDLRRLVFSITTADDEATVSQLVAAIGELATSVPADARGTSIAALWPAEVPPRPMTPREGFGARITTVTQRDALDRISAEMIVPYPPGIPLLVPGELITRPILDTLGQLRAAGCQLVGVADPTGATLRCVEGA